MKRLKRIAFVLTFAVLAAGFPADSAHAEALVIPTAYMNDIEVIDELFPPARNQEYNDCWAFSAVGLAEFDMIVDNQAADRSVDYSELQLDYFTYHHVADPLDGTGGDTVGMWEGFNYLTIGGSLEFAARTLLQWVGLTSEEAIPYKEASPSLELSDSLAYANNEIHLQNVYRLNILKEPESVKREIMRHGAAGIGFYAGSGRDLTQYEGTGSYQGRSVPTYYCGRSGRAANHAVLVIGWDDDFPAENFKSMPPGDGAWLVRNSWSDSGGYEKGIGAYFWLSYYDRSLEADAWIYDFEEIGRYDYNYQYDGSLFCENVYGSSGYEAVANVFRVQAERNEVLEAVSVSIMSQEDVPYTIKIYTDLINENKPCSGYLAAKVSGTTGYAGVHTIELREPVTLVKGTCYSVVVELDGETAGIDVEYGFRVPGMFINSQVSIEKGQSFALVNGKWQDMLEKRREVYIDFWEVEAYTGNWCIKAYTSGLSGSAVARGNMPVEKKTGKNSISISWDKVSKADGYEIFRATSKNGTYKKIATVKSGSKTTYKDTGLTKDKTYYYRVRAYRENPVTDGDGEETTTITVGKMSDVKAIRTTAK